MVGLGGAVGAAQLPIAIYMGAAVVRVGGAGAGERRGEGPAADSRVTGRAGAVGEGVGAAGPAQAAGSRLVEAQGAGLARGPAAETGGVDLTVEVGLAAAGRGQAAGRPLAG